MLIIIKTFAGGNKFVRSYTAHTLHKNEIELELYYFNKFDKMSGTYQNHKPRFEIGYGLLDRLTASFYFNFNGTTSSNNTFASKPFILKSNSLELIYMLNKEGADFIDKALYFEFEIGKNVIAYEPKILFSKEIKNIDYVFNIGAEFEKDRNTNHLESKLEITGGAIYQIQNMWGVGIEFKHSRLYEDTFGNNIAQATFLGPTVSFTSEEFTFKINLIRQIFGSPNKINHLELTENVKYEFGAIIEFEI